MRQLDNHASDAGALALKTLSSNQDLVPGRYLVSINVNHKFIDRREIEFRANAQGDGLSPCLSSQLLEDIGVKLDGLAEPEAASGHCVDLPRLIPGALTELNGSQLALSISIPQIAMRRDVAGYVDPDLWDYGINSAFVNYQVSAQQGRSHQSGHNSNQDLYLNSGLNLGAWRLRSNNAYRSDARDEGKWSRAYTYVQRDLPGTRSQLTLGETYTPGDVFRSIPIKGMQIASDMSMLPDSQQYYAPIIRGVAQTRARLEVRQNGYPVYSTYVSAGPYEINDLPTAGGSGELEIILTEADGQVRRFTQPYATLNNLLREGVCAKDPRSTRACHKRPVGRTYRVAYPGVSWNVQVCDIGHIPNGSRRACSIPVAGVGIGFAREQRGTGREQGQGGRNNSDRHGVISCKETPHCSRMGRVRVK
ncbi:hypothetical protein PS914_04918 [Pseudomonas fluorescens]|nr:hypothetical protein PS914_04918 [Pseudomonas fluorescens]